MAVLSSEHLALKLWKLCGNFLFRAVSNAVKQTYLERHHRAAFSSNSCPRSVQPVSEAVVGDEREPKMTSFMLHGEVLCTSPVLKEAVQKQKPPNSWKGRLVHVVAAVQVAERKCLGGEWYMATGLIHPLRFSGTNAGLYTEGKWCSLCLRCGFFWKLPRRGIVPSGSEMKGAGQSHSPEMNEELQKHRTTCSGAKALVILNAFGQSARMALHNKNAGNG
ncbi:hypothetical protein Anapl_00821 [Anas platyrhynchos]|uniref:Uncharacterized protein n=1 Tax=Anas platyrhynchos TaxID=8839 RepID=R0K846_ANAPL|nr:hypothetical protein Anapl_00821 [Anas platyrhynchos]